MVTRVIGRVIAVWHSSVAPTDADWSLFLDAVRAADLATARGFVLTAGGTPTAAQRRALMELVGSHAVPLAVVSDLGRVRFAASLFAMMTKRLRSFATSEVEAACAHLALSDYESRRIREFVLEYADLAPP